MSEHEERAQSEAKARHVRIVSESSAKSAQIFLDGQLVRYCHRFRLEADANGRGMDRYARLTLEVITFDAEVDGDVVVSERATPQAAEQAALSEAYGLLEAAWRDMTPGSDARGAVMRWLDAHGDAERRTFAEPEPQAAA